MNKPFLFLFTLLILINSSCQEYDQKIIISDIDNFWRAYDKIKTTEDSTLQLKYLREDYLEKGTVGLKNLIEVRDYKEEEYLDAINNYPKFWESIRAGTLKANEQFSEIKNNIGKLKKAYPALTPATIYFAIGAFRTNGTVSGNNILIGSELSLAEETTIIDELPEWRQPFYQTYKPWNNLALLCTHEHIHTQQKQPVDNLLSNCLYEGVAEFISCEVTGKESNSPAIEFGRANQEKVVEKFIEDLYLMSNNSNWMWGENRNELKVRDLGYYIGYGISEGYYRSAQDKTKAIKELIELNYEDEDEFIRIVDQSNFFPKPLKGIYDDYEISRPTIVSMAPFENGSKNIKAGSTRITVNFSEPLNGHHTGIDFGPLGQEHCPKINPHNRLWGDDNRFYSFEAELKPNQHYQILISNNFKLESGVRLKPYLIEFWTE